MCGRAKAEEGEGGFGVAVVVEDGEAGGADFAEGVDLLYQAHGVARFVVPTGEADAGVERDVADLVGLLFDHVLEQRDR